MRIAGTMLETAAGPVEHIVEGSEDGAPVLVLHGSPGGIDAADAMSTFLPRDAFRVILLSRPGYLGTALGDRRSVDQQADLLAAVLDALGIERAATFGWSGGGPAAYRFAVRHPGRTDAVLTTGAVSMRMDIPPLDATSRFLFNTSVGNWLMRVLVAHQPEQVISGTLQAEGDLTSEQLKERTAEVFADDAKRRFVLDLSATVSQKGNRQSGYDNDVAQFEQLPDLELERIVAPTLLVHGGVDIDVPPAHTEHAAARVPGARTRILAAGTHLALWTHPDAASAQAEVVDFLLAARRARSGS